MSAVAETVRKPILAEFEVERIRADFPILSEKVHGHVIAYLDNAATAQKPKTVLDALDHYYRCDNANVHRGVHTLSERATADYEGAREKVRQFINAGSVREVVYVRGTTEGINLVAQTFGRQFRAGDEIIISAMEHHANIVPWQLLRDQIGIVLRVIPMSREGELLMDEYEKLLNPRTRLVAVTQVSNALGTINPVEDIIARAHARGVPVLLDGAQATPHGRVDVQALDCDFFVFSGHKMFAPTGIGILYGKESLLEMMPPFMGGGDMIRSVTFEKTQFNDLPHKFEAGTPNIADAIGLGAAVDYLTALDLDRAAKYEHELLLYATEQLMEIPGLRIIGTAKRKASVISFVMDDIHPHDLGTILDRTGIAVRAGHHCAMPVMQFYGVPATVRASMAFYNTREEVDRLRNGLLYAREVFG